MFDALAFKRPDVVPVEFRVSPAGMYEHGERLRDLLCRYGHDFGDAADFPMAAPAPGSVDEQGRYYEQSTDRWGTVWEGRIFGIKGHPLKRPLDDWAALADWAPPPSPPVSGAAFEAEEQKATRHRKRFFLKSGWINLFEVLHAVRRFEDVLVDVALDSPEINELADRITAYQIKVVSYLIELGVDAVQFADDLGSQQGLFFSPDTWRRFFVPRYERMLAPVKQAGKKAFFHTCGMAWGLFEDFAALGFDAVWPQTHLYNTAEIVSLSRGLKLALAIHPDRAHLMTFGSPAQIRSTVLDLAEAYRVGEGGAWFYVEIDNGFPFENIEALVETVAEIRAR